MTKYKLLIGSHFENGVTYRKDETLNSFSPLDERFPGRFLRLEKKAEVEKTPIPALTDKEKQDSSKEVAPVDNSPAEALYELSPREDKKFDVISLETGEAVNEKPLTKKQAKAFCKKMEKNG